MNDTVTKNVCAPCEDAAAKLSDREIRLRALAIPRWKVIDNHLLSRSFSFPDFASALSFVNTIGAHAEEEGHHPDITLSWGLVTVTIYTHALNGLSEHDFILAEIIDGIPLVETSKK